VTDQLIGRRSLLKAAAALAGGTAVRSFFSDSILRAFSIDPAAGSTFEHAEHIVFLMQENRSFDHCFGTLQGVRGFNDPRAIDVPGGRPVWLQANARGQIFAPFHLDMRQTNTTWNNGLPHTWPDQVDARNHGKHDRWLEVKIPVGGKMLEHLPLSLGYCTRADIPFYYALADAFTVCDQHFCSSLTGTTPNRLHFWTGTLRKAQTPQSLPCIYNGDAEHFGEMSWSTFPERLSDQGIAWKVYQNELSLDSGLSNGEWLSNFGDNPLEYFAQFHPRFVPSHYTYLQQRAAELPGEIAKLESAAAAAPADKTLAKKVERARHELEQTTHDLQTWNPEQFEKLSTKQRTLHHQAFTTNRADPDYRQVIQYPTKTGAGITYTTTLPKGDILHQFREDVTTGKLPPVSWLAAPRNFSDHPDSAWFGAWYVSEVLNILTQNPEVWKKTIFVLNYDENDGYFDHCPPFVAPDASRRETGACSEGVDSTLEYTIRDRRSPLGLGYRVPMVIASPWSRGGWVNSQVFDLTSPIRFLETFFARKHGIKLHETNISSWRRTVCGDLTSVFRSWNGEPIPLPKFVVQKEWVTLMNDARYKPIPDPGQPLTPAEIEEIRSNPSASPRMTRQEPGTRPSCAIPYELRVDGNLLGDRRALSITFEASKRIFGEAAVGCPFQVYAPGKVVAISTGDEKQWEEVRTWNYAVGAGKAVKAEWPLADFESEKYFLRIYGPNGFYRELMGSASDPDLTVGAETEIGSNGSPTGNLLVSLSNPSHSQACVVSLSANAYGHAAVSKKLAPASSAQFAVPLEASFGWYDFTLHADGDNHFARRYAGRVETGRASQSDPVMGGSS
jgi:phospholipase C